MPYNVFMSMLVTPVDIEAGGGAQRAHSPAEASPKETRHFIGFVEEY